RPRHHREPRATAGRPGQGPGQPDGTGRSGGPEERRHAREPAAADDRGQPACAVKTPAGWPAWPCGWVGYEPVTRVAPKWVRLLVRLLKASSWAQRRPLVMLGYQNSAPVPA